MFKKFNKNNTTYWRCQHNNFPASVTTWNGLGAINGIDHSHDKLNESERKCLMVEEAIIKRAIEDDTPITSWRVFKFKTKSNSTTCV